MACKSDMAKQRWPASEGYKPKCPRCGAWGRLQRAKPGPGCEWKKGYKCECGHKSEWYHENRLQDAFDEFEGKQLLDTRSKLVEPDDCEGTGADEGHALNYEQWGCWWVSQMRKAELSMQRPIGREEMMTGSVFQINPIKWKPSTVNGVVTKAETMFGTLFVCETPDVLARPYSVFLGVGSEDVIASGMSERAAIADAELWYEWKIKSGLTEIYPWWQGE